MDKIRVVLTDDHTIVRNGLRALLNREPRIDVVDEAGDGRETIQKVRKHLPDVVVMDIGMPNMNGIEATRQIKKRFPNVRILILTMHKSEEYISAILDAGASGFVLKQAAPAELIMAIKTVHKGDSFLSSSVSTTVIQGYLNKFNDRKVPSGFDSLTEREREVLQLIAEGKSTRQIAECLFISPKTIEVHRSHLMKKLDLHNIAEIVRYALRKGIIDGEG
jgi:two-component system, NarL family, response regulator NreC